MDNTQVVCEEWETPINCYRVNGKWVAMKQSDNTTEFGYRRREILQVEETWDMLPVGERDNYKVEYLMEDGDLVIGHEGFAAWLSNREEVA